jgi:hypothetical protein
MRRWTRQPAQILPLFAVSLLAVTAFLGVAIDGSRLFRAHLEAQTLADEAADAAAQRVDTGPASSLRAGGPPELIQGTSSASAFAAANTYLAARAGDGHTRWTIATSRRRVEVEVQRDVEMAFFAALNVGTQTVQVASEAEPVSGITAPEN